VLEAENPNSGIIEEVFRTEIDPAELQTLPVLSEIDVRLVKQATQEPYLTAIRSLSSKETET